MPIYRTHARSPHAARRFVCGIMVLAGCDGGTEPTRTPAAVAIATQTELRATVGTVVASAPTFTVRDAAGQAIPGIPVTVTVTSGGGTLTGAPTRSGPRPIGVGTWTLGTRAGVNQVTVAVPGVAPLIVSATGIAGPAARIRAVEGDGQSGLAGARLPRPLVLEVTDTHGNGVEGAGIVLTPLLGGSVLGQPTVLTGPDGTTPPIAWTLGGRGRLQSVRVSAGPTITTEVTASVQSDFTIDVRFVTEPPTPAIRQIFAEAADRIRALIVGDISDIQLTNFDASRCGGGATPLTELIDDVVIFAEVTNIDGVGRVLGRAGPCVIRSQSLYSAIGTMQFDAADIQNLIANGRFEAVVQHELLHILGIGSLWRSKSLLETAIDGDPRFVGARGVAGCLTIGFGSECPSTVPVENTGGSGTANAHWRESVFDAELMTGFAESTPDMPLSALTLGALEDYGYLVNYPAVDPFFRPAAVLARPAPGAASPFDEILLPWAEVTSGGWVRWLRR